MYTKVSRQCYILTCPFVYLLILVGGMVASWLMHLSQDQVVCVRALAGGTVFCSWTRHFTLTVPLFTQMYKWVPANLVLGETL